MTLKNVSLCLAALVVACLVLAGYGKARWNAGTTQLLYRLDAAQVKSAPQFYNAKELEGLPAPVKRYFQTVLKDGQPIITAATVQHMGTFNMSETGQSWKPFTSTQRVTTNRPGFDWDARVMMFPVGLGIAVHIHDAYVGGSGLLKAAVLGLIPIANLPETADLSKGELMRFYMEAAWYPTALLPSQGVVWKAVDATSADATFTDAGITINLRFGFGADGLIHTVLAAERGRLVGNQTTQAPWQGRFSNYADRGGMLVPLQSEVAWILPVGVKTYYRSLMTTVSYEFSAPPDRKPKS
ncbi:MAG: DUF6544 family protein [Polaromonas sp.]